MSCDSKSRGIVKRYLNDRTPLIEQCQLKSYDEVMCGKTMRKSGIEKMVDNFLNQM